MGLAVRKVDLYIKSLSLDQSYVVYLGTQDWVLILTKVFLLVIYHCTCLPSVAVLRYSLVVRASVHCLAVTPVFLLLCLLYHDFSKVMFQSGAFVYNVTKHDRSPLLLDLRELILNLFVEAFWYGEWELNEVLGPCKYPLDRLLLS